MPHGLPSITPAHVELFVDGEPLTVAPWPNADADEPFARIAGFSEDRCRDDGHGMELGLLEVGFYYAGDRPRHEVVLSLLEKPAPDTSSCSTSS